MNTRVLLLGWLATVVVTSGALGFDVSGKGDETEGLGGIAEDIEIMQRLLGKALSRHYGGNAGRPGDNALNLVPWARSALDPTGSKTKDDEVALLYAITASQHARLLSRSTRFNVTGYYIAGVGALFTFNLPISLREVESSPEGEESRNDPWTQTEGEVRGTHHAGPRLLGTWSRKKMTLDETALRESIDVLLEAVGKFGLRIEGLSTGDSIVLAARLEGAGVVTWTNELWLDKARGRYLNALGIGASGAYRVTVRIPVSAIREFEDGDSDLRTLRQRSEITRYRVPASSTSGGWRTR